ncbi:putative G-protein coupled receptor 83-like protein [Dinothrombium tinctorium]|uniref:Putative G-protein coupled receptor 83-like protein n=1 Tax=Dinothrombium tinctorium TaxID=1965070 RepID=A0A3S3QQS5_9ACAR|nr:putative G-protein coupled receptor 83-like protein [Dinothrombium tinctorium]RWS13312.1 putative G-protein coupled receptor 83-like protein [Dinothrombium tinctorium]RWS15031.1 putative G-protein coupled receptor 83-like protein [Dinothrombium tinctorium]RWS15036.1 putative G-protein coupled receptor 83-like protein [Dinothrombium tinctorium]
MNNTSNTSSTFLDDEPNHFVRDIFLLILYSVTAILALFGNFLVCRIIFARNSTLRNSTNILVGNLAFSDIIGGITIPGQWIFCSSFALDTWRLDFPCAVSKSLQVLSFYMSSLIMMLIAIERFISIMYPMSPPFRSKLFVTITWIVTTLFVASSMGSAKIFEYFTGERLISCRIVLQFKKPFDSDSMRTQRVWGIWMGQYFLPLFVTGVLYAIIAHKIWTHKKLGISSNSAEREREAKKKKIIIMLIIVVLVFVICWLPLHALNFTDYVIKNLENRSDDLDYKDISKSFFHNYDRLIIFMFILYLAASSLLIPQLYFINASRKALRIFGEQKLNFPKIKALLQETHNAYTNNSRHKLLAFYTNS